MREYVFQKDQHEIPKAIDFIRECLQQRKISRKKTVSILLAAEEILGKICDVATDESQIKVEVGGYLGNVNIRYSGKGSGLTLADIEDQFLFGGGLDRGEEAEAVMLNLMQKMFGDDLSVKCENGKIHVKQQVKRSPYAGLVTTLLALVLGLLAGLLMQDLLPESVAGFITKDVLTPVYTVLMNALKLIVAPLVFFSIASSIADFSDIRALGRVAGKVVVTYILTSALAVGVGYLTSVVFPIGNPELAQAVDAGAAAATIEKGASVTISIKDTLVGIVPTDIITPFLKSDMLQVIFLAICLGLAAAVLSKSVPVAREFTSGMNKVFSKITAVIVSFMPVMVFCSMAKMMATMKVSSFVNVITCIPAVYLGDVLMIFVYLLLLLILARLNPFRFIGKYYPAMISAFTLSSSNAALPSSINQCKKLGISEKVYSFSLPLGATINMDGSCITLVITALFFARIYQLPITGTMLLQLFIAVMVLSLGSPGVPGGNLVCLTLLIPQIGIPAEAVSLVMGIYPIISMMQTLTNVTGDAVVTLIAAKTENLVDLKEYNKRS